MSDDIADSIESAAQNPKRFKEGKVEAEAHSIRDQIAAYEFLQKKTAAKSKKPWKYLRFCKVVPPGGAK